MNFIRVRNDITGDDELINLDQISEIKLKSRGLFTTEYNLYFGGDTPALRVSGGSAVKLFDEIGVKL
ncbi:MAG: hypothetical protein Q4A32_02515 [Lachnospiraceae bacterium]|nr:hypothetical protein [Lachnospiraceae bacterium]